MNRLLIAVASVALGSCGGSTPPPKPPAPVVPKAVAPPAMKQVPVSGTSSTATTDATKVEIAGLVMPKPASWTWEAPSMQFRALQYAVPAAAGASGAAELVFSVFAAGDGGPIDANVKRWETQFRTDDGSSAKAAVKEITAGAIPVKIVELSGNYQGMGQAAPRPGILQLGAIVQPEGRTVYIRLVGPSATVEAARAQFMAMVEGARLAP